MKNKKVIFMLLVFFTLLFLGVNRDIAAANKLDFSYIDNGNSITITKYIGNSIEAIIPEKIKNKPVTELTQYTFSESQQLKTVTIPSSVEQINENSFENCSMLERINVSKDSKYLSTEDGVLFNKEKTILISFPQAKAGSYTIPEKVEKIESMAFSYCKNITSITLSKNISVINEIAFIGCMNLTAINVSDSSDFFASEDGVLFNKDKTELISCPNGKRGNYAIPSSVKTIGNSAFCQCQDITSITIPESVNYINDFAFFGCKGLSDITIPSSVYNIGYKTFGYCDNLINVSLSSTLKSTGVGSFAACKKISKIVIPEGIEIIDGSTFSECENLKEVILPNSVEVIDDNAFMDCSNLRKINFSNKLTTIGRCAFSGCISLIKVNIPSNVSLIGDMAFANLQSLTSFTVDKKSQYFQSIDGVLFDKYKKVLIQYPSGKKGNYTIPTSVEIIELGAFSDCGNLTSITITNCIKEIRPHAFQSCTKLKKVVLPNKISEIGEGTFQMCSNLDSVVIPASVQNIGDRAFMECEALKTAYFYGDAPALGYFSFEYVNKQLVCYYLKNSKGFSNPWNGLSTKEFNGENPI